MVIKPEERKRILELRSKHNLTPMAIAVRMSMGVDTVRNILRESEPDQKPTVWKGE